jgi:predicted nucleotidyltransferase component of viral defense system
VSNSEDFRALVAQAMRKESYATMRPVIEKELLHYDILFALDRDNLLDKLTFQGGTLLRLCYGAPRLSEDLDFAGGENFNKQDLVNIKQCVEDYIGERYNLEVSVKEPKLVALEEGNQDIKVEKWQVSVTTAPGMKDLPKQKIKIEVINVPAYSRVTRVLKKNYDFLPDGYSDVIIMCESLEEVYVDKIISLINSQKYIRYRDIWDLRWIKQQNILFNEKFLFNKIKDYQITDFSDRLEKIFEQLSLIIHGDAFRRQMSRFIPTDVQERTLLKEKFYDLLTEELVALLSEVRIKISDEFKKLL